MRNHELHYYLIFISTYHLSLRLNKVLFCLLFSFAKKVPRKLGLCFAFLCLFLAVEVFIFASCFVELDGVLMDSSEYFLFLFMTVKQTCVFI